MTFRLTRCVAVMAVLLLCPAITPPALAQADDAAEITFWESIRDTDSAAELKAYLDAYPNGKFAPLAKIRLKRLKDGDDKKTKVQASSAPDGQREQKEKAESPEGGSPDAKTDNTASPKAASKAGEKTETTAASGSIPGPKERKFSVTLGAHPKDSTKPLLGVQISNLPDGFAEVFGFAGRPGILVPSVTPAAAADKAGIRPGHVIVAMNGSPVPKTARAFAQRVGTHKPGDDLSIEVLELAPSPEALVESLKRRAESGGSNAAWLLGYFFSHDGVVDKDETESAKWYRKAADKGHAQAAYQLGRIHSDGRGVAKDEAEAAKWYRKAADLGDPSAMFSLGWRYANGRGVAKNEAEAVKWYRKAAEKGLPAAMNNLGYMYRQGRGVSRDEEKAFEWSLAAALQGVPKAFRSVADDYFYGRGTQANPGKALKWYRKSAEAGNAGSMLTVGQFLAKGVGAEQDAASAADWTIRGLKAGDTKLMNDVLRKLNDLGKDFLRELQKRLKAEGHYADDVDGIYGSGTKSAIEALVEKDASQNSSKRVASVGSVRSAPAPSTKAADKADEPGWLGVSIQTVTDEIAKAVGLQSSAGALVAGAQPGSPAADAGLEAGDVILKFEKTDIETMRDLPPAVAEHGAGAQVEIVIWRNNAKRTLSATLGRFPEKHARDRGNKLLAALGLSLAAESDGKEGARITKASPDGEAAKKGLRSGHRIMRVGGETVSDRKAVAAKIFNAYGKGRRAILLLISDKDGNQRFVALSLKTALIGSGPSTPSSSGKRSIEPLKGLDDLGDLRSLD